MLTFAEWCTENGYDFSKKAWVMCSYDDYILAYVEALTEYAEWRLDNAGI